MLISFKQNDLEFLISEVAFLDICVYLIFVEDIGLVVSKNKETKL